MAKLPFGKVVPIYIFPLNDVPFWTFFIWTLGCSSDYPMPQVRPSDRRRKLGEHIFFWLVHEIMSCPEKVVTGALPEGGCWGVWCSCRGASPSWKGEPWSMSKPVRKRLWWMLSFVLSRLLMEAAWLFWPDFACEQGFEGQIAHCRDGGDRSAHCRSLCTVGLGHTPPGGGGWFLSSWIWASSVLWSMGSGRNDTPPELLNHKFGSRIKWWLFYISKFLGDLLYSDG